ncbi:MAG: hypothetical protein ABIK62_04685, partial [candidate division WOR-3 bacterium]
GRLGRLMKEAAEYCWALAAELDLILLSLNYRRAELSGLDPIREHGTIVRKLRRYNKDMSSVGLTAPKIVTEWVPRLDQVPARQFAAKDAYDFALKDISELAPRADDLAESVDSLVDQFGRAVGRRDYDYMVYHDIKDSTATKAGREGKDVAAYRDAIQHFTEAINNSLHRFMQRVRKNSGGEVYPTNGNERSMNDCKHIFVGGNGARSNTIYVVRMLLDQLRYHPEVRARIYVVPCRFVGVTTYRLEQDTEVEGQRFWDHWSRLKKAGDGLEAQVAVDSSFLLVATDELIQEFKRQFLKSWRSPTSSAISTEAELLTKTTTVCYGQLRPSRDSELGASSP